MCSQKGWRGGVYEIVLQLNIKTAAVAICNPQSFSNKKLWPKCQTISGQLNLSGGRVFSSPSGHGEVIRVLTNKSRYEFFQ